MTALNLHIGLHKTGTSHFQSRLENTEWLPSSAFLRTRSFRRAREREDMELLQGLGAGCDQLFLSDENILGLCGTGLRGYQGAGEAVAAIVALQRWSEVRISVSLRNYASWLPSCFAEAMRVAMPKVERLHRLERRWPAILAEIRSAVPEARLLFWTNEDYRGHTDSITAAFCNGGAARVGEALAGVVRPSPSAEVLDIMASIPRIHPMDRRAVFKEVQRVVDGMENTTRFDPFTDAVKAEFTEMYEEDLEAIGAFAERLR